MVRLGLPKRSQIYYNNQNHLWTNPSRLTRCTIAQRRTEKSTQPNPIPIKAQPADLNMDDSENTLAAIYRAVDWINGESPPDRQLSKAPETQLLGSQSILDSMHLVSLIVAIERELEETFSVALTLADERALSMKASPFRSIQSLADYIGMLMMAHR
jgi:acyl carrier protein